MLKTALAVAAVMLGLLVWALRPVCTPLAASDLRGATVPMEQRTDRDLYLRVFQQREGQWYQCKTWLSRRLFF